MIYDSAGPPEKNVKTGPFQHPVDLGGLAEKHKCEFCHQPNKRFVHPINLGDISMFQCVECHPRTRETPEAGKIIKISDTIYQGYAGDLGGFASV